MVACIAHITAVVRCNITTVVHCKMYRTNYYSCTLQNGLPVATPLRRRVPASLRTGACFAAPSEPVRVRRACDALRRADARAFRSFAPKTGEMAKLGIIFIYVIYKYIGVICNMKYNTKYKDNMII